MERRTTRSILQIALLGAGLAAGVAVAAFKWVDEKGVTHFSQFPPPGQQFEQFTPKAVPPPSGNPAPAPESAPAAPAKQPAAEAKPKPAEDAQKQLAAVREENCKRARANLNTLNTGGRLRYTDADGTVRYLTDEERAQRIEEAQKQISDYCEE